MADKKTDSVLNDKMITWMMKDIGVDLGEAASNIHDYMDRVAEIESSGNPTAANQKTSAKGLFQWLNGEKPDGSKGTNVFKEDLEAARLYYKKSKAGVPEWVKEGLEHNDPTKLSEAEQKKLFLARMYRLGKNEDLQKAYSGDREAQRTLYFDKHHTDPDPATMERVDNILPGPQGGQAVEAAAQIPLEGMPGQMNPAVFTDGMAPPQAQGMALDAFRNAPPMGNGLMRTGKEYNL